MPLIEGFAEGEARVEDTDAAGEVFGKAADGLGGEGDFGDEDDAALALLDGVTERVEIYLGLAGAGHAMEDEGGAVLAVDG